MDTYDPNQPQNVDVNQPNMQNNQYTTPNQQYQDMNARYQKRLAFSEKFKIKQREVMTMLQHFTSDLNDSINKGLDVFSDDLNGAVDNINRTINNLGQAFDQFNELQRQDKQVRGQTNMFNATQPNQQQQGVQPDVPSQQNGWNMQCDVPQSTETVVDLNKETETPQEAPSETIVLDTNKISE